jgi:hypothetical protein
MRGAACRESLRIGSQNVIPVILACGDVAEWSVAVDSFPALRTIVRAVSRQHCSQNKTKRLIQHQAANPMKIVSIDQRGIKYVDQSNQTRFIDFETCRVNWLHHITASRAVSPSEVSDIERSRCVGQRNGVATPAFIEFWTQPVTRFEFCNSLFRRDARKRYWELYHAVINTGWQLLDMT